MRGYFDVRITVLSRSIRLAVQGLTVAGVVAGSVAFTSYDKAIQLTVDGQTRTIHAFGDSVADVLASEKLTIGGHDIVSPAPSAAVKDGTQVTVRYGRQLTVAIDGRSRQYWTTELTVEQALQQVGLRAESARLSVDRSLPLGRQGLSMKLNTRKDITLVVAGKSTKVTSYAGTLAELLAEQKLTVGKLDRLSAVPTTPLLTGSTVTLDRVEQREVSETLSAAFKTTSTESSSLERGTTKITTKGKPGTLKVTYLDTYTNGRRTARKTITTVTVTAPVTQVQQVGTKAPAVENVPTSGDGLNWDALAQCESGGNPRAVNPNGHYGLFQFSPTTWRAVGGSGNPADASASEQLARAKILYDRAGAGQWSCGSHLYD